MSKSTIKSRLVIVSDALVAAAYCALIFWLSNRPGVEIPSLFPYQDKAHHAAAYGLMGLLAWRCFRHLFNHPFSIASSAMVFSALFGLSDELHQAIIPSRSADWFDWLADTAGAGLALGLLYCIISRRFFRRRTIPSGSLWWKRKSAPRSV